MSSSRKTAPHVQAALAKAAVQPKGAPAPGGVPAPAAHVRAALAANRPAAVSQLKSQVAPPAVLRPAAHVQAAVPAPAPKPPAVPQVVSPALRLPHAPPPRLPVPPASRVPSAVQLRPVRLPLLGPVNDAETGKQLLYENDAELEIDTDDVLGIHMPDIEYNERQYFIHKFRAAYNSTRDLFLQDILGQVLNHLRTQGYGPGERRVADEILQIFQDLTRDPVGVTTPTFQTLISQHVSTAVDQVRTRAALSGASLQELCQRLRDIRYQRDRNNGASSAARASLFQDLATLGLVPHPVPAANHYVSQTGKAWGDYEVGASVKVWVSVPGTTAGQDVVGWEPISDLNYKYWLIYASHKKLVAAHLLPALLGGRLENKNLTPITNEANGWLSNNPEKHAKALVFSAGRCIEYEVQCTFGRAVFPPIENDVAEMVPATFTVNVTPLKLNGTGDGSAWGHYELDGAPASFPVPAGLLSLDILSMGAGVTRSIPVLDRSKLKRGLQ